MSIFPIKNKEKCHTHAYDFMFYGNNKRWPKKNNAGFA